ncbi:peptidase M20, partial [Clostridioides difficile]|nr:peptidase M20 [Clostridioides difficile]
KSNKADGFVCAKIAADIKTDDKKNLEETLAYYTEIEEREEGKVIERNTGKRDFIEKPTQDHITVHLV